MNGNKKELTNKYELQELGINQENIKIMNTVEEVQKNPPNMVVAECIHNISFIQNKFKLQKMGKKIQYCMGLGVYSQLRFDEERKLKILKPGKFKFKNVYKPYKGQNLNNKTLLIWRTGGVGDLIFINPILRHLKELYPTCKIKMACGPQYQSMIENFKEVDEVLDLPFPATILFEANYHAIFEGIIERTREAENTNAYILFSKALGLNIPVEKLYPIQEPKSNLVDEAQKTLNEWKIQNNKFVLLQPRASSPIRTPRYDIWEKIIEKIVSLGYKVVITDSPHQKEIIDQFILGSKVKDDIFNYVGISKSLDYTIAMASLSEMCISTDSALIHIGASLGRKIFGLYGPFPAHIRMSTYINYDYVEPKNCPCAPCFRHGHLNCANSTNGNSNCYDMIDMDECFDKIEKLLKK
jgi:ADP-heptose:LPS heptosyltransferase/ribosomal protein S26